MALIKRGALGLWGRRDALRVAELFADAAGLYSAALSGSIRGLEERMVSDLNGTAEAWAQ